jgi:hypothetical protein
MFTFSSMAGSFFCSGRRTEGLDGVSDHVEFVDERGRTILHSTLLEAGKSRRIFLNPVARGGKTPGIGNGVI